MSPLARFVSFMAFLIGYSYLAVMQMIYTRDSFIYHGDQFCMHGFEHPGDSRRSACRVEVAALTSLRDESVHEGRSFHPRICFQFSDLSGNQNSLLTYDFHDSYTQAMRMYVGSHRDLALPVKVQYFNGKPSAISIDNAAYIFHAVHGPGFSEGDNTLALSILTVALIIAIFSSHDLFTKGSR